MKALLLSLIFSGSSFLAFGQWHDNHWIFGYDQDSPPSETMLLDFGTFPITIIPYPVFLNFRATNATMSDAEGNLIFYSNGIQVHNVDDNLMPGGDSLNAGEVAFDNWPYGYSCYRGMMALPKPGNSNQYYLIHEKLEYNDTFSLIIPDVLYSIVDMGLNNGKGAVISKNNLVMRKFYVESAAATKHANGRDWWVLVPDLPENKIYRFRLTPEGIVDTATQIIGYKPKFPDSVGAEGQNIFSPDGSFFIDYDGRNGIRIYDFDRCTGLLSNFRWIKFPWPLSNSLISLGAAVSPNSRFLYVDQRNYIFQLDLWADDIAASMDTVAVYDGFEDPPLIPGIFGDMMPTPDGKIYVSSYPKYQHIINRPNEIGLACDVRLRSWLFPDYIAGTSYYPNYRLGPLDGSPCDTLGLDNHSLARFTWEVTDSLSPLLVGFTDNSFYEPTSWSWDFGGLGSSTEINPLFVFPASGTYTVCLTVSNQYSSDTFCREVTVGTTGAGEQGREGFLFSVSPNPATSSITLAHALPPSQVADWQLINHLGQPVKQARLTGIGQTEVSLEGIPNGLYFYRLLLDSQVAGSGKLVVAAKDK